MRSVVPVIVAAALLAVAAAAEESGGSAGEPERCREVVKGADDPVQALRDEEARQWRAARKAGRQGRKAMARALAAGPAAAGEIAQRVEQANQVYFESLARARELCHCRLARGAAEPEECERKYPSH